MISPGFQNIVDELMVFKKEINNHFVDTESKLAVIEQKISGSVGSKQNKNHNESLRNWRLKWEMKIRKWMIT